MEGAKSHIKVLELRTATLIGSESPSAALKASTSSTQAYSLENRQHHGGGVNQQKRGHTHPALTAGALELWAVALTAGVSLTAQHIIGIQNVAADTAPGPEPNGHWTGRIYTQTALL